jgi:hypothetical protein
METEYIFIKDVLNLVRKFAEEKNYPEIISLVDSGLEHLKYRRRQSLENTVGTLCIEHSNTLGEYLSELLVETRPLNLKARRRVLPGQTELLF